MLLKSRQKRGKALLLLLDHADDYGAKVGEELRMGPSVLHPQDRDALHEKLIEVGSEDGKKLEALK